MPTEVRLVSGNEGPRLVWLMLLMMSAASCSVLHIRCHTVCEDVKCNVRLRGGFSCKLMRTGFSKHPQNPTCYSRVWAAEQQQVTVHRRDALTQSSLTALCSYHCCNMDCSLCKSPCYDSPTLYFIPSVNRVNRNV